MEHFWLFLLGSAVTMISLTIGFNLGHYQSPVNIDSKKKIDRIFKRVIRDPDVGPIERPTAKQNYYRDNPQAAREDEIMEDTFDNLNKT